jgi:cell division protein FtsB
MEEFFRLILLTAILGGLVYSLYIINRIRANVRMVQARFAQMNEDMVKISRQVDKIETNSK